MFKDNKKWIYFIIFCLIIAALSNRGSRDFFGDTIGLATMLYLFGALSWAILNYFEN